MNTHNLLCIDDVDAFVFDFDGVLTTNKVYINHEGEEFVCCSRSDGLAFDTIHKLNKPVYILSTEKNKVVAARANKLKVNVVQSVNNKVSALEELVERNGFSLDRIFFVGNDLNDLLVMEKCGYTACPRDSHQRIRNMSDCILNAAGGCGVVREVLEDVFCLNIVEILYGD